MKAKSAVSSFESIIDRIFTEFERRVYSTDLQTIRRRTESAGLTLKTIIEMIVAHAEFRRSIRKAYVHMEKSLSEVADPSAQRTIMISFLATFSDPESSREDIRAFDRWMDVGAVRERARIELHSRERIIQNAMRFIPAMVRQDGDATVEVSWARAGLDRILSDEFDETPRWQNQQTILDIVYQTFASSSADQTRARVPDVWIRRAGQLVGAAEMTAWIQVSSFRLLDYVQPEQSGERIMERIRNASRKPDDVFSRAGMIRIYLQQLDSERAIGFMRSLMESSESSDHVKMSSFERLAEADPNDTVEFLADFLQIAQCSSKLRAVALYQAGLSFEKASIEDWDSISSRLLELLSAHLDLFHNGVTARSALDQLHRVGVLNNRRMSSEFGVADVRLLELYDAIIQNASCTELVRRKASCFREEFLIGSDAPMRELFGFLRSNLDILNEGESLTVDATDVCDDIRLGRVLSLLSQKGFGYSAAERNGSYLIVKGDLYQRRIWRILHEVLHPDPAKRQGFLHSVGRSPFGTIRAPSHILSEMTETKVPGERLYLNTEATWRPYLPSVDDLLSLSSTRFAGREIRIFSSDGITRMTAPDSAGDRIGLWLRITRNYKKLSYMRNMDAHQLEMNMKATFVQTIEREYGIHIDFTPHEYAVAGRRVIVVDPIVRRHLGMAVNERGEQ